MTGVQTCALPISFSIQLNPFSGNVYITEAYNYTVKGDVLCFNQQGQLQYRLNDIGLNPNTVVFSDKASQNEAGDTPEDPNAPSAFANKVFEYIPAPGQFINTTTSAYEDGFSAGQVLERATEKLKKKSVISLGGFVPSFLPKMPKKPFRFGFLDCSCTLFCTITGI